MLPALVFVLTVMGDLLFLNLVAFCVAVVFPSESVTLSLATPNCAAGLGVRLNRHGRAPFL